MGGLVKFISFYIRGGCFLGQSLITVEPNKMKWVMNRKWNLISPPPPKIRSRRGREHNLKCLQEDFTTLNG